jgi:Rod binding domain-containing protein
MNITAARSFLPLAGTGFLALNAAAKVTAAQVKQTAQDFESLLLGDLLKQMRQTLEPGGLFGKDSGDVFGGLFDLFLSKHLADAGGLGLADYVERQLRPDAAPPAAAARPQ